MKSNDQMPVNRGYPENDISDNEKQKSVNGHQKADKANSNVSDKDNTPASIKDLPEIKPARSGILG